MTHPSHNELPALRYKRTFTPRGNMGNSCCCVPTGDEFWLLYSDKQKLRSFCWLTAWIHLVAALAFISLTARQDNGDISVPRLRTQTTRSMGLWLLPSEVSTENITGIQNSINLNSCSLAPTTPAKESTYVVKQVLLSGWGEIDTRIIIIMFHILSFLFQAITSWDRNYYEDIRQGKTNLSHFIEYSVSASILLVAMCAQLGITDFYLILSIAANCWGCMVFGLVAELLFEEDVYLSININWSAPNQAKAKEEPSPMTKILDPPETANQNPNVRVDSTSANSLFLRPYKTERIRLHSRFIQADASNRKHDDDFRIYAHWLAHVSGWFLLTIALIGTTSNLITMKNCVDPAGGMTVPDWVQGLIGVETGIYCLFGLVQTLSFIRRTNKQEKIEKQKIAEQTEFAYIFLSLSAKLGLGLFVYIGNLTNK